MVDIIFVMFGGHVFQQTIGILMGINGALLLFDLFLYSYETYFIHGLLKKNEKKVEWTFNFRFLYIPVDDPLILNKRYRIQNGQSREIGNTIGCTCTRCRKANHNYVQTNTNNVNKTWALLQTTGGDSATENHYWGQALE